MQAASAASAPCGRLSSGKSASTSAGARAPAAGRRFCARRPRGVPCAAPPSSGEGGESPGGALRPAADDGSTESAPRRKYLEDLWRNDVFFMDRRGRRDTRKAADGLAFWHELVVAVFGRGERPALQAEAERLAAELEAARQQARVSELRLSHSSARVAELERALRSAPAPGAGAAPAPPAADSRVLDHWFPVAYASALGATTLLPFDLFGAAWVLFRDAAGAGACIADSCAHRACPLSLGKNIGGRVQCAYHGWEFAPGGACELMPSTPLLPGVTVRALPVLERDGLLWVWPGRGTPAAALPRLAPPKGFTPVAATSLDVERDADALVAALLAATSPAAGATASPNLGSADAIAATARAPAPPAAPLEASDGAGLMAAAARALRVSGGGGAFMGAAPAAVTFEPPGAVVTTLTLGTDADAAGAGDADADDGTRRVHVLFACVPALPGRTRVLYRLAVNFTSPALAATPGAGALWQALADDLLREQLAALDAAAATGAQQGPQHAASAAAEAFAAWRREMMQ